MKIAQILLIAVFTFCASISVQAQSTSPANAADSVLAGGNPPLLHSTAGQIVELFEFALEAKFSGRQRDAFIRHLKTQWEARDTKAIQSYAQLIEIYEKVKKFDPANQREARVQFQAALIEELRQNPQRAGNRILIEVYNQAHPESAIRINLPDSPAQPSTGGITGRIPGEIVGTWQTGTVSSTSYTNSVTGATTNAGGTQVMYRIFEDGRYEYTALTTQTAYNCTTNLLTYKTGRIEASGPVITFVPLSGKFTSEDNCNRQYNYEKPANLDRETYNFRIERDEYGTKICLQNATVNGCAYKRD